MGVIFSTIFQIIKSATLPIRRPFHTFELLLDSLSWAPTQITSNEAVQLAMQDFNNDIISPLMSSLKYWLLPVLFIAGLYATKHPPASQINEVLDYYTMNSVNTIRPYEYKYPIGAFAEHLKSF